MNCIFCDIVIGKLPSWKLYEDDSFIVMLDKFPNRANRGQSLVISKQHMSSYYADIDYGPLISAITIAKRMAKKLDTALGSMRTCLVFEGMEIDHFHIKLYPIYKDTYPNYLSTYKDNENKGVEANDEELNSLKIKIK